MGILVTRELKKYYGKDENIVKAVDGINLEICQGEFVAVVGESGSGKSTLLHLMGGLDRPTSGDVCIGGENIYNLKEEALTEFRRRNIGFVFQSYNLIPILNVYENIILPISLNGETVDKNLLDDVIVNLGISDKMDSYPAQLSGGQQQRVAIARAIVSKPSIIMADEPTGNLDSKTSRNVIELIGKVKSMYDQTVVMITHDMRYAQLAERILNIEDGKINETIEFTISDNPS